MHPPLIRMLVTARGRKGLRGWTLLVCVCVARARWLCPDSILNLCWKTSKRNDGKKTRERERGRQRSTRAGTCLELNVHCELQPLLPPEGRQCDCSAQCARWRPLSALPPQTRSPNDTIPATCAFRLWHCTAFFREGRSAAGRPARRAPHAPSSGNAAAAADLARHVTRQGA